MYNTLNSDLNPYNSSSQNIPAQGVKFFLQRADSLDIKPIYPGIYKIQTPKSY